jgi:hypothetical protein
MNRGLDILPEESVAQQLKDIVTIKDNNVEQKLYKEMSEMIAAHSFSWCKWNNQKYSERKCVFRTKAGTVPEESEGSSEGANSEDTDSLWRHCLFQERSCFMVASSNLKYSEDLQQGAKVSK